MMRLFLQKVKARLHFIIKVKCVAYNFMGKAKSLERTANWQQNQIAQLLNYAKHHCKYYEDLMRGKEIHRDNAIECLKELPLLDKAIIRKEGDNIYSNEISVNKISWANTGGSTGNPLCFPIHRSWIPFEAVHQYFLYRNMGWKTSDIIIAIDGSRVAEHDVANNIYWVKANNFPFGKYALSTLYMKEDTMSFYVDFLNKIKPAVLRGYPSGILLLGKYLERKGIVLSFHLKGIYLTSEGFSKDDQEFISSVFSCPVYGQYGHTEASIFGMTQANGRDYFCSPFYGYVEVLNEQGVHVNEGEIGEIVVTGFSHLGLPFIRYKTGDLAMFGGMVKGWTVLNTIYGRTVDFIVSKTDEKVFLTGFIFGGHLRVFNDIEDWQIEQFTKGIITISLVPSVTFTKCGENEIISLFATKNIEVEIKYVDCIPRTSRGKKIFMKQHLICQ